MVSRFSRRLCIATPKVTNLVLILESGHCLSISSPSKSPMRAMNKSGFTRAIASLQDNKDINILKCGMQRVPGARLMSMVPWRSDLSIMTIAHNVTLLSDTRSNLACSCHLPTVRECPSLPCDLGARLRSTVCSLNPAGCSTPG